MLQPAADVVTDAALEPDAVAVAHAVPDPAGPVAVAAAVGVGVSLRCVRPVAESGDRPPTSPASVKLVRAMLMVVEAMRRKPLPGTIPGTAAALTVGLWLLSALGSRAVAQESPGARERPTLAILEFPGTSIPAEDLGNLGKGIAGMLSHQLGTNPSITVLDRAKTDAYRAAVRGARSGGDPAAARNAIASLGIRYVVSGAFILDPRQGVRLDARVVNPLTGVIESVVAKSGPVDDLIEIVAALETELSASLNLPPRPAGATVAAGPPRPPGDRLKAVRLYGDAEGKLALGDATEAINLCRQALALHPELGAATALLNALMGAKRPG
jgi:TolB-like protein